MQHTCHKQFAQTNSQILNLFKKAPLPAAFFQPSSHSLQLCSKRTRTKSHQSSGRARPGHGVYSPFWHGQKKGSCPLRRRSNPSLLSPGLWSPSLSEKQAFQFMCLCCQQWSHAEGAGTAPDDLGDAEMYEIRQGGEQKGNKRFQRALLPLSLVTVDSFIVINFLTSSFCDKWGRTDWTWWLIYQWIASFPFKPRPHWWSLWFSTTSWEGLQPDTGLAVVTSSLRNSVWDTMFLRQTWW